MLENKKIQLFCLAHAGGSTFFYQSLKKFLPHYIEWIPIDIKGHGKRLKEPLSTSFEAIIEDVLQKINEQCQMPFTIFGHSLGGLVAYVCAQSLREKNMHLPCHIFLSSPAYHGNMRLPVSHLSRDSFFKGIQKLGGFNSEITPEFIDFIEPILRNDLQNLEEWESPIYPALPFPITLFTSTDDMKGNSMRAYAHKTWGDFTMHIFEGNHFYIQENWENLARIIDENLKTHIR